MIRKRSDASRPRSRPAARALATALALAAAPAAQEPAPEELAWLRAHAVPLAGAEAGSGFADLAPLRAAIGDARIVALGEATHGSREVFRMKHRLVEYLASELGFTVFSIEASTPEAYAVGDWVLGGAGDPARLIGGMYFWTWNTEEVLDLVRWMRAFDAGRERPLRFTGFDMQTPDVAMEVVVRWLEDADPARAREVRDAYASMVSARGGAGFAAATGAFPVELARGKRVRFRGWIRTRDLEGGWAGLWWRNDLPDRKLGGFDNMHDRGPRGTADWREYELELDVPEATENINFGVLLSGRGAAWFDGLAIEVDGVPFEDERFDLGYETGIRGFSAVSPGFTCVRDAEVARAGEASLRIESLARDPGAMDAGRAAARAEAIASDLRERRGAASEDDAAGLEWALHNARIVEQCMRSRAGDGFAVRDASMAENVAWILEQDPDARIVLWAHNGHVQEELPFMGGHLAERFGDDYLSVGFATGAGRYTAVGAAGLADHPLQAPPADSVERVLAAAGEPLLALDLREARGDDPGAAWLREPRPFRSIGALAMDEQFFPAPVADQFDLLIWIRDTTPARQLATPPGGR